MKITRRKFLIQSSIGALGLALAPGLLKATAGKAPAAAGTNPLFTGALGRYEGVNIIESIPGPPMVDLATHGKLAVKTSCIKDELKAEWIPINKFYRQG